MLKTLRCAAASLMLLAPILAVAQPVDSYRDVSSTVTLGGTSQTLAAANPGRNSIHITHSTAETEVLCVNVTSDASCTTAGTYVIAAGGYLCLNTREKVTVVAATTGHKYTAKEGADTCPILSNGSGGSSGGLTDTELRATPVPVSGTVSITSNSAVNVAQINGVTTTMGNGVSGTGVQRVTIASDSTGQIALATGSATIGALTANQSVNVAQMNGVATSMGSGANGTGVQRVTVATDDVIVASLATKLDTINTSVNAANTQLPAALGTAATASSLSTAISTSDAGPVAPGTATATRGISPVGTYTAAGITLTDGQQAGARMTSAGALQTNDAATLAQATISAGAVKNIDSVAGATDAGFPFLAIRDDTLTALTPVDGDYVPLRTNNTGALWVQVNGGSVQGLNAHDAASTMSPMQIGCIALTAQSVVSATGDASRSPCTMSGALITRPYSLPEHDWNYAAAASGIVNTTTAVTIQAAGGAGLRNYVTALDLMCEALTNATEIAIRDGAAGAVLWRTKVGTGGLTSGRSIPFPNPLRGTAATLLEVVTLTASGAGACYINASGYTAP